MDFKDAESRGYTASLDKDSIIESMRLREQDYKLVIFYLLDKLRLDRMDEIVAEFTGMDTHGDLRISRPKTNSYHVHKINFITSI